MSSHSHSHISPMEQGELDASPDYSDTSSPEVEIELHADEDDSRLLISMDDKGKEPKSPEKAYGDDDTLDIKPPQSQAGSKKEKHKHKDHKHSRDRDRHDKGKHSSSVGGSSGRERERQKDRGRMRDIDWEKPGERNVKEIERREKSIKERFEDIQNIERLERLERERHRLERERQREEEKHMRSIRMERERAARKTRAALERERERKEESRRRRPEYRPVRSEIEPRRDMRDQERYRDKPRERSRSPPYRSSKESRLERFERQELSRKESPKDREVVLSSRKDEPDDVEIVIHDVDADVDAEEDGLHHQSPQRKEKSGSESDSADTASEDSESDSDERSERSGSRSGGSDKEHDHHTDKVKSKFDDEDEHESAESVIESDRESDRDREEEYIDDDTPPPSPVELKPELPPYFPALQGCRSVEEFHCLNRIEEGTFGVVYRARDKKTDEILALKRLKMEREKEGFPITSLREINTLLKAQHLNIVTVREIVVGSNMDKIYIVMEYVEHDLKSLMETMKEPFIIGEVKCLMQQLLRGVAHLHDNWIIHRDLKTSNLLLSHKGILKVGDFGLAREYGSPLKQYTPIVVTLWYRAPEILLGCKEYSTKIDIWSVGCIFAEFLTGQPLFPGKSEIDQLNRIFKDLGTPTEKIWPGVSELPAMKKCSFTNHPYNHLRNSFGSQLSDKGFDLMNRFLTYDPVRRVNAEKGLTHEYFDESPRPIDPSMFPTWPAKSEQPRRSTHGNSPKAPSGGKAYANLLGHDDESLQGGFHLSRPSTGRAASGAGFALKFGPQ